MQSHRSHFAQLLSTFQVSGTELAEFLHIDSSLISKWKNNKRSLKGNTPMLDRIADYFISLDSPSSCSTIRTLISNECENLAPVADKQLKSALKYWLLSSYDSSDESFSLQDYMSLCHKGKECFHLQFRGNSGKRDAILGLLKIAVELEPRQELWCIMHDTQKWFTEEEGYADIWSSANLAFLQKGNSIHIIHAVDRQYSALAQSLLGWLPLYLTGKVNPYFSSPHNTSYEIRKSVVLLKDNLLLYGLTTDDDTFETTTVALTNPTILNEAYQLLQIPFQYATPLFTKYYLNDHYKYSRFLSHMVNLDEQQYVFMRFPFVNVMSTVQIQEILEENEVADDVKKNALQACQTLKTDARKNSGNYFRYLVPKSQLEVLLAQDKIMLDTLSFFSGKPLYISNETFRNLLRRLSEILVHESHKNIHEIALLEDVHVKQLRNLNMFVKKNTCISIFNSPEHFQANDPLLLTTTESSIILSLFMYCDQLWRHTIPQNRDKAYVSRQLHIMTETIFPE